MKRLLLVLTLTAALVGFAQNALASCTTHTIMSGGRIITCTTCCNGGYCTTNCF